MESAAQWIMVAHILRPQGRRGEVLADLFTDFPERFDQQPRVWLAVPGFADGNSGDPKSIARAGSPEQAEVASSPLLNRRFRGRRKSAVLASGRPELKRPSTPTASSRLAS